MVHITGKRPEGCSSRLAISYCRYVVDRLWCLSVQSDVEWVGNQLSVHISVLDMRVCPFTIGDFFCPLVRVRCFFLSDHRQFHGDDLSSETMRHMVARLVYFENHLFLEVQKFGVLWFSWSYFTAHRHPYDCVTRGIIQDSTK